MATKSPNQRLWRNLTRIVFLLTLVHYAWMIYAWATADEYIHARAVEKRKVERVAEESNKTKQAGVEWGEVEKFLEVDYSGGLRQGGRLTKARGRSRALAVGFAAPSAPTLRASLFGASAQRGKSGSHR